MQTSATAQQTSFAFYHAQPPNGCNRDAVFMAVLSLIIFVFQIAAFASPLFSYHLTDSWGDAIPVSVYFSKTCSKIGYGSCVYYPETILSFHPGSPSSFDPGQIEYGPSSSVTTNLAVIIIALLSSFFALVSSRWAGRVSHGILFLLSFIFTAVSVGVTTHLNSETGGSSGAGLYLLWVSLVLSLVALIRACFNKALCGDCCDPDHGTSTTSIVLPPPSSAATNYGATVSINEPPQPRSFPEWMSSLPIEDHVRSLLIQHDVKDEESFLMLEENDLKEMGVTLGPSKHLMKEILQRKQGRSSA